MNCNFCVAENKVDNLNNPVNEATTLIWSPTWSTADRGPAKLCQHHIDEIKNHKRGTFLYGDDAKEGFNSVENFITRDDDKYQNAKGMILNGHIIKGSHIGPLSYIVSVVDGKAWLGTYFLISCLGDYSEAKAKFPNLFA